MKHPVLISIYDKDGSVAVSHGGVEMGQGLNTKVSDGPESWEEQHGSWNSLYAPQINLIILLE